LAFRNCTISPLIFYFSGVYAMKKFSALVVSLVLGVSSVSVAHAQTPPPAGPVPGVIAPVESGLVIGGVGIPAGFAIVGGVLVAIGVGVAISNANNNDESSASTPTSTSTSTSTR
jgi:hypothetical protein